MKICLVQNSLNPPRWAHPSKRLLQPNQVYLNCSFYPPLRNPPPPPLNPKIPACFTALGPTSSCRYYIAPLCYITAMNLKCSCCRDLATFCPHQVGLSFWHCGDHFIWVFLKWSRTFTEFIEFRETDNHCSMNWARFEDLVPHMCLAGAVVAWWYQSQEVTGVQICNVKFFVTESCDFSENI